MEVAISFYATLCLVAILLMVDLYRNRSCEHCAHCKQKASEKAQQDKERSHEAFHAFRGGECTGSDCPGYRKNRL